MTNYDKEQASEDSSKVESFDIFISKFYSDTVFQRSRIAKPLGGIITEWDENIDSVITSTWSDKNLTFVTDYNELQKTFKNAKHFFIENKDNIIEKIQIDNSGFFIEREYKLEQGKWYLTRYELSNL